MIKYVPSQYESHSNIILVRIWYGVCCRIKVEMEFSLGDKNPKKTFL